MKNNLLVLVASTHNYSAANYLLDSFTRIGYKVFVISDVKTQHTDLVARGAVNLEKVRKKYGIAPKLILYVEGGNMGLFPTNFEDFACPKFWWGIDTHNDYQKHLRISRLFDHTFIAQKSYVQLLSNDGITSVSWLPLAYPLSEQEVSQRLIDVSYVGSRDWALYPERRELLESLSAEFSNVLIDSKPSEDMLRIYRNSKIVFNHSLKNDINMRYFEAMGSGALLCTNNILDNGLEDLFIVGEDLIVYKDKHDLISLIKTLLDQPSRLEMIAKNGMQKVNNYHTYDHRAAEIITKSEKYFPKLTSEDLAFSGALLSMGFISDAFSFFFSSARTEAQGVKNRFVVTVLRPLTQLIVICSRLIEKFAKNIRRRL